MKWFREYILEPPITLPLIIVVFQELIFWNFISVGDLDTVLSICLALVGCLALVIFTIGQFDRKKWTAPLFGLAAWDIVRLGNMRSTYVFLLLGFFALTMICLALMLIKKIKLIDKQGVWILLVIFGINFVIAYDASETIYFNLLDALFLFGKEVALFAPGLILDVLFHQQFHWQRGLTYFAWVPIIIASSTVGGLPYRTGIPFQIVGFLCWTLATIVFFLVIPKLQSEKWEGKIRENANILIAVITIVIIYGGKWGILTNPQTFNGSVLLNTISETIFTCAPIVLLFLYYRRQSKIDEVS